MLKTLKYRFSWIFASARAPPFIGVDISKATLDWAVFDGKTIVLQSQSANSAPGIKTTLKLIKALPGFAIANSVCCMEHTGIYNAHIMSYLRKVSLPIWLENSLQIKKSGGLQRGKNDAIDAQRIAEYARAGGPVPLSRSDAALATTPAHFAKARGFKCASPTAFAGSSATSTTHHRTGRFCGFNPTKATAPAARWLKAAKPP